MLRLCNQARHTIRVPLRCISSSSSSAPRHQSKDPINYPQNDDSHKHISHSRSPILHQPNILSPSPSRKSLFFLSATLVSAIVASVALLSTQDDRLKKKSGDFYDSLEHSIEHSKNSFKKIFDTMKQTGVAATVLLKSLSSVLSSANQEVRSGFELRVASLLADIVAANESRRLAIVSAGGGAVVDWLLETVAFSSRENSGTQAESARALAYLISDQNVCGAVLGRPHAVPNLLRFIFSYQPQRSKKKVRSSLDGSDTFKGRSMLVAAIMDIVTSNCDNIDGALFHPSLPADADMRDIAAAIEVIEEGGMHLDEPHGCEDDDDGGKGMRGIGIKILGGTTVLGFSRANDLLPSKHGDENFVESIGDIPRSSVLQRTYDGAETLGREVSISAPGLWDDLQSEHVAVPFAAWALANWALASDLNRTHIQELDHDGLAVMAALVAPERTVKWHGSLVARLLLQDRNLPLSDSVPDWSASLLSTISHSTKTQDIPLAQMALSAFLISVERSSAAQKKVMETGLHLMRGIAKQTGKHKDVQELLAQALELLCTGDVHLSLEESQKWSGILLPWVCGKSFSSTDAIRLSAAKILSCILEDYGPSSIPISQGWLTILLAEILDSSKKASSKGSPQFKSDKVKTQMDQSNALSASQTANQLAAAVVSLAGNQLGRGSPDDSFPLADLLSSEPFAGPYRNLNKGSMQKFDAADSALATLKGIKALTEVCAEDFECLNKLADFGILCLLRRFLLRDDYEQLAANETYDASRIRETQERVSNVKGEIPVLDANDSSSIRVPPTAHIRRHAARLLNILSVLPKIQKSIIADVTWCKWLDDCANGRIPGCHDVKMQSYARATLLNIFCSEERNQNSVQDNVPDGSMGIQRNVCPRYGDMIFLINPELPHWQCSEKNVLDTANQSSPTGEKLDSDGTFSKYENETTEVGVSDISSQPSVNGSLKFPESGDPPLDIVFIHGLCGGPFKSWRVAEDKFSTTSKSGLVEKIDQLTGKMGSFWPGEWLANDFPHARLFTVKYKTNLTQWSGASLPLQEVSSMLLKKLIAAGIGNRPVVFVTHSMGGLVVKQMLYEARANNFTPFVNNTVGVVFYSCPHFGSKLADMPWRMGLVLRPAPTIGELRSGSPRLVELNDLIRRLHKKGSLEVLSFSETKVTPIVEGYGGWAIRMEIVPIESAYPGFGELVVLDSTDHINSCKPVGRTDPSYRETLQFLQKLKAQFTY